MQMQGAMDTRNTDMAIPLDTSVSDFAYTACYCEENAYLVCQQLCNSGKSSLDASDLRIIFISNPDQKVPIWRQKASSSRNGLVVWDYHVICLQVSANPNNDALVWDLDTTLNFPECFSKYVQEAFRPWLDLHPSCRRLYRVVSGPLFLKYFSSDRRHMKAPDGSWKMPPPPYECIRGLGPSVHNLDDYIKMSHLDVSTDKDLAEEKIKGDIFGVVFDDVGLKELFS